MILGVLGIGYGFLSTPKTTKEVKEMLHQDDGHGGGHASSEHTSTNEAFKNQIAEVYSEKRNEDVVKFEIRQDSTHTDAHEVEDHAGDGAHGVSESDDHVEEGHGDAHGDGHGMSEEEHLEHELTFAQNRPWTAIYVAMLFFLLVSVCAFVYYCIQRAASAGWSPVLFRVMEGVSAYIVPGSIMRLIIFDLFIGRTWKSHVCLDVYKYRSDCRKL